METSRASGKDRDGSQGRDRKEELQALRRTVEKQNQQLHKLYEMLKNHSRGQDPEDEDATIYRTPQTLSVRRLQGRPRRFRREQRYSKALEPTEQVLSKKKVPDEEETLAQLSVRSDDSSDEDEQHQAATAAPQVRRQLAARQGPAITTVVQM